jgi:ankyrin repeat protein
LAKVKALLENNPALISSKAVDGGTPLHPAALHGHKTVVELFLARRAEVDAKSNKGYTPLQLAAAMGHRGVVEMLLAHGADVNSKDAEFRWTPLHWAAGGGHKDVVEALLANKPNVNAKDDEGRTPLLLATNAGHTDVTELLRQHGGKAKERGSEENPRVTIRCAGCSEIYQIGVNTVAMTNSEAFEAIRRKLAQGPTSMPFAEVLMIRRITDSDHKTIQTIRKSGETILRLGPQIGWQCGVCRTHNPWRSI